MASSLGITVILTGIVATFDFIHSFLTYSKGCFAKWAVKGADVQGSIGTIALISQSLLPGSQGHL
jgi:hypothetical protein